MTYFVSVFETVDLMANPIRGAGLFMVSKPSFTDDEMVTHDVPVMVGYGSTSEAALLALRAGINSALGAVELEITQRRKTVAIMKKLFDSRIVELEEDDHVTDIQVIDETDPDEEDDDDGD